MKNKKIIIVLLLAVTMCIVSAVGIYAVLTPQRATIFVFREDYTAGTQMTQDLLVPVQVDATIVEMGKGTDIRKEYVTSDEYSDRI